MTPWTPYAKPAIITVCVYPPIPQRFYDYCAYRDGYEPGCPIGWGSTREIAIADLLELEEDDNDDTQWCEDEQRRDDAREGFES